MLDLQVSMYRLAGRIPAKATKHLKSHLVTRFLIGNKKRETRMSRYQEPTPTAFPETVINRSQGQMGKHPELAQDTHKWLITFTSNTTLLLRFSKGLHEVWISRYHFLDGPLTCQVLLPDWHFSTLSYEGRGQHFGTLRSHARVIFHGSALASWHCWAAWAQVCLYVLYLLVNIQSSC